MESPLAGAVESGDVSQVIHLLNEGVDVNSPTGLNGETALMLAAYSGNIEILTFLLSSHNININQQDLSGQTALIIAAYQGHQEFVQYLISRQGVNPNLADYRGVTPLLAAILHGQTLVANTLLSLETIDINCTDLDSRTPLLAAISQGMPDTVVRLVSSSRLRLDQVSGEGKTALQVARDTGQSKIAQILETAEKTRNISAYIRLDSPGNNIEQRLRNGFRCILISISLSASRLPFRLGLKKSCLFSKFLFGCELYDKPRKLLVKFRFKSVGRLVEVIVLCWKCPNICWSYINDDHYSIVH